MIHTDSLWTHGRSLRNNRGRAMLPEMDTAASAGSEGNAPAARAWIEAARHEFASIASFRHVARSLECLSAPEDLIDRSISSADDERHHTKICLDLATAAGATAARIVTDVSTLTRLRRRPDDLASTARSALLDGVVGEGFIARRLDLAAERSTLHQRALQRMADDERRHSALGLDIVRWCVSIRPWIVDQLKLDVADLDHEAPVAAVVRQIDDADRTRHGLYLDRDATAAWAASRTAATDFIHSVRHEVA